jgi:predicted TPR repeat methyltransferase
LAKKKKGRPTPASADELIALGRQHAERGDFVEAEIRFREAIAAAPGHLHAITLLGLLLIDYDQANAAIDVLEPARDAAPHFAPIQLALGSAYAMAGHDEIAVAAMETAIKLDSTNTLALERLAKHHVRAGRPREAIGVIRRILRRDPANQHANFLMSALAPSGETTPLAQPPELVAELFDSYATTFDKHLDGLEYRVPKALAELVAAVEPPPAGGWMIVDLGCGTGLAGVELRGFARTLIGGDLSPRMIARANERAIYDELHVEDLAATLARVRDVDLLVAADVFIYIGALEATMAACAAALRPGGLLAFSTELSSGEDIVLHPTLRYAHSESYLLGLARTHGLAVERAEPQILRVEKGQPVHGVLHVLRR